MGSFKGNLGFETCKKMETIKWNDVRDVYQVC